MRWLSPVTRTHSPWICWQRAAAPLALLGLDDEPRRETAGVDVAVEPLGVHALEVVEDQADAHGERAMGDAGAQDVGGRLGGRQVAGGVVGEGPHVTRSVVQDDGGPAGAAEAAPGQAASSAPLRQPGELTPASDHGHGRGPTARVTASRHVAVARAVAAAAVCSSGLKTRRRGEVGLAEVGAERPGPAAGGMEVRWRGAAAADSCGRVAAAPPPSSRQPRAQQASAEVVYAPASPAPCEHGVGDRPAV